MKRSEFLKTFGAAPLAASPSEHELHDEVLDVKSFGATGDGTTDDAGAIQAALDAGAGGSIYLPTGTYNVGAELTVSANSELVFAGGATLSASGGSNLLNLATGCRLLNPRLTEARPYNSIPDFSSGINVDGASGIEIIGGYVDRFTASNIRIVDSSNIHIRGMEITLAGDKTVNRGRGIRLAQGQNRDISVRDCYIHRNGHHGIQALDSSFRPTPVVVGIVVADNLLIDNGDNGVDLLGVEDFAVTGNVCYDNGDNEASPGGGQGVHVGGYGTRGAGTQYGTIVGNTCRDHVAGFGIEVVNTRYCTIGDNSMYSNDFAGLVVRDECQHVTVTGNVASANQDGIRIDGTNSACKHIVLTGNVCTENVRDGIRVDTCSLVSLGPNVCNNNGVTQPGAGILIRNGENNQVSGVLVADDQASPTQEFGLRLDRETAIDFANIKGSGNVSALISLNSCTNVRSDQSQTQVTLRDADIIAVDVSQGDLFSVTLGGDRTMGLPTNAFPGKRITFLVTQDARGSHDLEWDDDYHEDWRNTGNRAFARSTISFMFVSGATGWIQEGAQFRYQ